MEKGNVKFAMHGEPGLLVLEVPSEIAPENVVHACLDQEGCWLQFPLMRWIQMPWWLVA